MDVVSVVYLVVFVLATLVAGSTDVLHAVGMVGFAFDDFETGCNLFLTLGTLETLWVPVFLHCLELLPHDLLYAASTSELTDLFSTEQTVRLFILHRVLTIWEALFAVTADETGGVIVIPTHIHHRILNELITAETLFQVGCRVTPFTQKLTVHFNVPSH